MNSWRARGGFTLIELLMVMSIIAVLATFSYPVALEGSRQYQLIRCLSNGRRLGQATLLYYQDGGTRQRSDSAWINALEQYGAQEKTWLCPTHLAKIDKPTRGTSDFMYAGARPEAVKNAERAGELYLWVEKYPYHNGMHVCVMGDGRATAENLLKIDY